MSCSCAEVGPRKDSLVVRFERGFGHVNGTRANFLINERIRKLRGEQKALPIIPFRVQGEKSPNSDYQAKNRGARRKRRRQQL